MGNGLSNAAGRPMEMLMRVALLSVLLLMGATVSGCLPVTSREPIGATVGFSVDPHLLGTWKASGPSGDSPAYLHILGGDGEGTTALLVTSPVKDNPGDWGLYRLRSARLGENNFVNVQEVSSNGKPSEGPLHDINMVFLYRQTGPKQITVYRMDDKAATNAIHRGEIAGEVEPGAHGDVRITARQPALDAFMKTPRAGSLFSKVLMVMGRLD